MENKDIILNLALEEIHNSGGAKNLLNNINSIHCPRKLIKGKKSFCKIIRTYIFNLNNIEKSCSI